MTDTHEVTSNGINDDVVGDYDDYHYNGCWCFYYDWGRGGTLNSMDGWMAGGDDGVLRNGVTLIFNTHNEKNKWI